MTKPRLNQDWIKKFDKEFHVVYYPSINNQDGYEYFGNQPESTKIKAFIQDLLDEQREEIKKIEVKVMGDDPDSIMPCHYTKTIGELYGNLIDQLQQKEEAK